MEYQMIVFAFVACIVLSVSNVSTSKEVVNAPALCEPGIVEGMPPHIQKVCNALQNSNQLSSALNQYIHNEAAALLYRPEDLTSPNSPAGKRTDVDHVFLRFGRRR
ncbi:dromyosuppressin [Sitodiplosis mosellana]|uniref:dromyosuppressin n=1 Tax=Sitodiplosis mosellana TaxID=263140 RepID=UPI0024439943|nr:dromyosuppressin [Sitodiplosis mosellana]